MTATCRCGAWVGHPEARTCTIPDCELRGAPVAETTTPVILPRSGVVVPHRFNERASDREADRLVGANESAAIHEVQNAA